MLGLALDSAGQVASAALWRTSDETAEPASSDLDRIIAHRALPPEKGKADQLISVVEQLLDAAALTYADLDVIAVNRGPGSFTGIRSAVALGRGLALATGCPVIGVTSHEALAARIAKDDSEGQGEQPCRLMIAEDARRGEVYAQGFDVDLTPLGDVDALIPEKAALRLIGEGRWRLGGSGAGLVRRHLDEAADIVLLDDISLDARGVALAADRRLSAGETPISGFDLLPLYIRPPDAVRPKPLVAPLGHHAVGERL